MENLKNRIISLTEDYVELLQPPSKYSDEDNTNLTKTSNNHLANGQFEIAWESCLSNQNNNKTTHPTPLLMKTDHKDWAEIEIQNIMELLEDDRPKRFFLLAIDFQSIKSSLQNNGIIRGVKSETYKDIVCSKVEKYILLQESTSSWSDDTLVGIARVSDEMKSDNSFDDRDKQLRVIYLSLSRSNQTLCDIKINDFSKIERMLRSHVENLRKCVLLPYVAEIYVSFFIGTSNTRFFIRTS